MSGTEQFADELVTTQSADLPPEFFDRFMVNLHAAEYDDERPSLIVGLGAYPPRNVVDGYVTVLTGGEQRNLRFATELDATDGRGAGPLTFEVLVPNERWRLWLADNPTGAAFDLTWTARAPYSLSDVDVANDDGGPTRFEHLVQSGRWAGALRVDDHEIDVTGWYGQRDRSRGVRTMSGGQGLHVWFQAQFPHRSIGFLLVEDRTGAVLLLGGAEMREDGTTSEVVAVGHDLHFDDGLDLRRGRVVVTLADGRQRVIDVDAGGRGTYMAGAGYGGWHGQARGRDHVESDTYLLDGSVSPRTLGNALTDRLARFECAGVAGVGIMEFAHSRSASYTYRPTLR